MAVECRVSLGPARQSKEKNDARSAGDGRVGHEDIALLERFSMEFHLVLYGTDSEKIVSWAVDRKVDMTRKLIAPR